MRIYLASSWRNQYQAEMVIKLREKGFDVYDFKNPEKDNHGFSWKEIDSGSDNWTTQEYISILNNPIAKAGFDLDFNAMVNCDLCVLLLPCGRSAHLEAGWFRGCGKPLFIYIPENKTEPELMYKLSNGVYNKLNDLLFALEDYL